MGRRSVSQLNSVSACGERYRIERTLPDIPRMPAAWTSLGTAIHKAYEVWELDDRVGQMDEIFCDAYDADIQKSLLAQPDLGWWGKTPRVLTVERDIELRKEAGIKQAVALQEHCKTSEWRPWTLPNGKKAIEVGFEVTFGSVVVRGYIDLLKEWPDGQVTPLDWKTGNKTGAKFRQLGLYGYAMALEYDLDIELGEFYFTKDGTSSGFKDLRRYTVEYLTDQYTAADEIIERKLFIPNPGSQCDLCGVKPFCREQGPIQQ